MKRAVAFIAGSLAAVSVAAAELPSHFAPKDGWTTRYEWSAHCTEIRYIGFDPYWNPAPDYRCGDAPWQMVLFLPDDYRGGRLDINFSDPKFVWAFYLPDFDGWDDSDQFHATVDLPRNVGPGEIFLASGHSTIRIFGSAWEMSSEISLELNTAVSVFGGPSVWRRIPEPGSLALLGLGAIGLAARRTKRVVPKTVSRA